MLENKSKIPVKDPEGKVSLTDVIDLLKGLQQEVQESVEEIKTRKARLNRQKLQGSQKTSGRNRGTHLRLVTGADHAISSEQQKSTESIKKFLQPSLLVEDSEEHAHFQNMNTSEKKLQDSVPEMEELKEIMGLLEKLEE